jgi:hypothetical protein
MPARLATKPKKPARYLSQMPDKKSCASTIRKIHKPAHFRQKLSMIAL